MLTHAVPQVVDPAGQPQTPAVHVCPVAHARPQAPQLAASLAVLGDFVPMGLGHAVTTEINSNSLDNTLRVVRIVPTDWVLVDIRIEAVANGFGHGHIYLWAEDGTLMGTASQSAMIRPWKAR